MALPDVKTTKEQGLGRRAPSEDNISGLVMQGVATVAGESTKALALGEVIELRSTLDIKGYGIDEAYDESNKMLVYHHIERFFLRNPSATLFLMLVDDDVTLTDMCDMDNDYVKKLLVQANGKVRQFGVALNVDTEAPNLTDGILADVLTAVVKAQQLCEDEYENHRPVVALIEGRHFDGTPTAVKDLRTLVSPEVAVVIASDYNICNKVIEETTPFKYYAALGDVLGIKSLAKVNESLGWVGKFPLTILAENVFVKACLSSGNEIETYEIDWGQLHDKGFIFAKPHVGKSGYWLNGSPTCTGLDQDEAYLENSSTLNKASRLIRQALLDDLNSPIELTKEGKIHPAIIGELESKCETKVGEMLQDKEISALSVFIDPDHNFIEDGEEFTVEFSIVPVGVARKIRSKVKLVAKL